MADRRTINPRVLYTGNAVMLLGTSNEDGTTNLAPASSYWALGHTAVLGLEEGGQTLANLRSRQEMTISFLSDDNWRSFEAIAETTGNTEPPQYKRGKYRYVTDKFSLAGLTPEESELIHPQAVAEAQLQFETTVRQITPGVTGGYAIVEAQVMRVHAQPEILVEGTDHIDTNRWRPTIYTFRDYFSLGRRVGGRPGGSAG
jgi:flavin reductase (DIM6/NTAB) family NADH-FMN oxidoreductase RutF